MLKVGKNLVYTAPANQAKLCCNLAIFGQNAIKLLQSGWYISGVSKVGKNLVYTACTSKSGTTLKACNSAIFGQNAIKLWHSGWHISGMLKVGKNLVYTACIKMPKMAELQAFKMVPELLVHGVYTIFLSFFNIPEIYWPLCSKIFWGMTKIGRVTCLQSCAWFAVACGIHHFLPTFNTPEIYRPLQWSPQCTVSNLKWITGVFWKFGHFWKFADFLDFGVF